ncbi:MAG: hypothetical protein NZ583_01225 [Desulfobacterota bacterium]|nr:hypothetical protein [Thermodesulfobacteriota bacterium]MDW8001336.1 hypothetical protein [Deltaproteobacteria bacterium]
MRNWVPELNKKDLKFISETLSLPEHYVAKEENLEELLADESLFRRVMNEDETFVRISPFLFFKILIKRAHRELRWESYTLEKHGMYSVYVFDTDVLSGILDRKEIRDYLAVLLASFSKVKSFVLYLIVKKKVYKFKQSGLDVEALEEELNFLEEEKRFPLLRRIADTILFLCGIFPDYVRKMAESQSKIKKKTVSELIKEFEEKGALYYHLAAMHEDAKKVGLSDVLYTFGQNFSLLKKPLNLIEKKYLAFRKEKIF